MDSKSSSNFWSGDYSTGLDFQAHQADDIIDESNEYDLLYNYASDFGRFEFENELIFNGEIELAKNYESADFTNLYHQFDLLNGDTEMTDEEISTSDTRVSKIDSSICIQMDYDSNNLFLDFTKDESVNYLTDQFDILSEDVDANQETIPDHKIPTTNKSNRNRTMTRDNEANCEVESSLSKTKQRLPCTTMTTSYYNLPRYSTPKKCYTSFQRPREPRTSYLLRSLKLWQEFTNSGNLEDLKILFNDILTDNCIQIRDSSGEPTIGRDKMFELRSSFQSVFPDYCVFFNNMVRTKKRAITVKVNSFGTFPNTTSAQDLLYASSWNIFENTPVAKLSEHHQIQKQKYDALKFQNKPFKMEKRGMWYMRLTKDCRQISKIASSKEKVDIIII